MQKFVADKVDRLDKFLASRVDVSRSRIQKVIKDGLVSVNRQKIIETDFQIKDGDMIEIPEFEAKELKPADIKLSIVFENDDLAVIDKPAGLVVHPGAGNKDNTLANALLARFPGVDQVGDPHRPGIVHRLDEYTSGLIIIAKTTKGFEYLKQLFLDHKVEKEYLALVHGKPLKKHDIINAPLEKLPMKQKMKVGSGKEAITEYWVLDSSDRNAEFISASQNRGPESSSGLRTEQNTDPLQFSLLRVKLHTGRTHQIRAHLAHIGHPIVGDQIYGKPDGILGRQFLHAYRLKFQLMDGTWIELESELPEDLVSALKQSNIIYR